MDYAIMRCNKLNMGKAGQSLKHAFREQDTPNADPERTPSNELLAEKSTDAAMGRMRKILPDKFRKDAVVAVEYLFTTSPEWAESASPKQVSEFMNASVKWLIEKHGKENIFVANVHRDETTPHLSAFVVPKTKDGRLSAKEVMGNRIDYQNAQTSFAKAVEHLGLERGIKGSKAKHERVQNHYTRINQEESNIKIGVGAADLKPREIGKKGFRKQYESPEAVALRISKKITGQVNERVSPTFARATERDAAVKQAKASDNLSKRMVRRTEELTDGLTQTQLESLKAKATEMRKINQQRKIETQKPKPKGPSLT